MGTTAPKKLAGEQKMLKDPLRVVPTDSTDRLDSKSRLDFGRAYPIEHNVKIREIGDIHRDDVPKLIDYRRLEKNR